MPGASEAFAIATTGVVSLFAAVAAAAAMCARPERDALENATPNPESAGGSACAGTPPPLPSISARTLNVREPRAIVNQSRSPTVNPGAIEVRSIGNSPSILVPKRGQISYGQNAIYTVQPCLPLSYQNLATSTN